MQTYIKSPSTVVTLFGKRLYGLCVLLLCLFHGSKFYFATIYLPFGIDELGFFLTICLQSCMVPTISVVLALLFFFLYSVTSSLDKVNLFRTIQNNWYQFFQVSYSTLVRVRTESQGTVGFTLFVLFTVYSVLWERKKHSNISKTAKYACEML